MSFIVSSLRKLHQNFLHRSLHPVRALLPDRFIRDAAAACGHRWRCRLFDPVTTLLACIYAHIDGIRSARQVEDWINRFDVSVDRSAAGVSFCDARKRLPLGVFLRCCRRVADVASEAAGLSAFGLRVLLVDGTGLRLGRTEANEAHFSRHAGSRRPLARAMLISCAGTGAFVSWMVAPFRCSERWMLNRMLRGVGSGKLLIGDGGTFSYLLLSRLVRFGNHALLRLPAWKCTAVRRKRLARGDQLQWWRRPRRVHTRFPRLLRREPELLCVRVISCVLRRKGYRDLKYRVVTTLLDPAACPKAEIMALYARRWDIELDIRDLKRTHLPAVLGAGRRRPRCASSPQARWLSTLCGRWRPKPAGRTEKSGE